MIDQCAAASGMDKDSDMLHFTCSRVPGRYNNATERPDPEMIMSGVQTMPFVYPLTGEERVQVLWRGL